MSDWIRCNRFVLVALKEGTPYLEREELQFLKTLHHKHKRAKKIWGKKENKKMQREGEGQKLPKIKFHYLYLTPTALRCSCLSCLTSCCRSLLQSERSWRSSSSRPHWEVWHAPCLVVVSTAPICFPSWFCNSGSSTRSHRTCSLSRWGKHAYLCFSCFCCQQIELPE